MHHCGRFASPPTTRREMLRRCGGGLGAVALAALVSDRAYGAEPVVSAGGLRPHPPHHPPKARSVIFLFMEGGPSQVDTFDPKPLLDRENGQPFKMKAEPTQFNNNGKTLASPWKFRPGGTCGTPVSDLFPHVRDCMDDIAVVRSMTSAFSEHAAANYFLHTGAGLQGRPSMGSWASYGLGSECHDLPGFVVLNSGKMPIGGPDSFNNGFLPATHQGSVFRGGHDPVAYIKPLDREPRVQRSKLEAMRELDRAVAARFDARRCGGVGGGELRDGVPDAVGRARLPGPGGRIGGDEAPLRARFRRRDDPAVRRELPQGAAAGGARRAVRRGDDAGVSRRPGLVGRAREPEKEPRGQRPGRRCTDRRPVEGPQGRGLLETTLVVFAGEFGRTPFAQGADGRDHNPFGFSIWLAGGGIKGGIVYGATDEYGYKAVEGKCQIHDLHATMLHLLGVDHKRLTYRWGGRDMRLTDVHGELIEAILA